MFEELQQPHHQVTDTLGHEHPDLGPIMNSYYDRYDASDLFQGTQHELTIFSAPAIRLANPYLLSELEPAELEGAVSADGPPGRWYVIGNFGTKDESLILDSATEVLYLFDWINYPNKQPELAGNFERLLERLSRMEEEDSVQQLLDQ